MVFTVPRLALLKASDGQAQPGGAGEPRRDMGGEAVAGHDVETRAGEQHDAGRPRLGVQIQTRASNTSISPVMSQ